MAIYSPASCLSVSDALAQNTAAGLHMQLKVSFFGRGAAIFHLAHSPFSKKERSRNHLEQVSKHFFALLKKFQNVLCNTFWKWKGLGLILYCSVLLYLLQYLIRWQCIVALIYLMCRYILLHYIKVTTFNTFLTPLLFGSGQKINKNTMQKLLAHFPQCSSTAYLAQFRELAPQRGRH